MKPNIYTDLKTIFDGGKPGDPIAEALKKLARKIDMEADRQGNQATEDRYRAHAQKLIKMAWAIEGTVPNSSR